ncbi:hypothetical protein BDW62DRAFT_129966 [Aspergillus aurantiobrunneus]
MSSHSHTGFQKPYFIVTWVEFGISILLLAARWYISLRIVKYVARDLPLAIATFTFGAASMVMLTTAAGNGLGVAETALDTTASSYALLFGWVNQFLALIAIGLGKLTIVAFLQQIQGYHTVFRTVLLWSLAGSNLIVNCIAAALLIVQCDPVQKLWVDAIPGSCSGQKRIQVFGYVQGSKYIHTHDLYHYTPLPWPSIGQANAKLVSRLIAWSAVCDLALALFPILLFARVRAITSPIRIGLSLLMGSGIAVGGCTIVKTIAVGRLTTFTDATRQLDNVIVWNQSEMWVVFIVS